MIDLHLHTTASDGRCTPAALVARAHLAGITILSVTDHDTVAGIPEAAAAAAGCDIHFVTGIEVTAVSDGRDVHVLGYFLDPQAPALARFLNGQREERVERARRIAQRLAALGAPIDVEEIVRSAPSPAGRSIARPLLARALVEAGHASSIADAFNRFLANDRPAYVPHSGTSPGHAVTVIREAGGLASLAHPGLLGRDDLIPGLMDAGLSALEAYHSDHNRVTTARYVQLARELDLAVTGGSDYHGEAVRKARMLGSVALPADEFARLRAWRDRL